MIRRMAKEKEGKMEEQKLSEMVGIKNAEDGRMHPWNE